MSSEPDQIRGEIHQTQQELSADVDAVSSLRLQGEDPSPVTIGAGCAH